MLQEVAPRGYLSAPGDHFGRGFGELRGGLVMSVYCIIIVFGNERRPVTMDPLLTFKIASAVGS